MSLSVLRLELRPSCPRCQGVGTHTGLAIRHPGASLSPTETGTGASECTLSSAARDK